MVLCRYSQRHTLQIPLEQLPTRYDSVYRRGRLMSELSRSPLFFVWIWKINFIWKISYLNKIIILCATKEKEFPISQILSTLIVKQTQVQRHWQIEGVCFVLCATRKRHLQYEGLAIVAKQKQCRFLQIIGCSTYRCIALWLSCLKLLFTHYLHQ